MGGKDLFDLTLDSPYWREVRAGTEAGTEAEIMNTVVWLAFHGLLSCFLIAPRTTAQGDTSHSGLGPPTSIKNQEKCPTNLPKDQRCGGISLTEVLSS